MCFVLQLQVNNVDFANIIREEAVLFLLDLPRGDEVSILAQKKKDGQCCCQTCNLPIASGTFALGCEAVFRRSMLEVHQARRIEPYMLCFLTF